MGRRVRGLGDAWPDEAVSVWTRGPARLPILPPPYPLDRDSEAIPSTRGAGRTLHRSGVFLLTSQHTDLWPRTWPPGAPDAADRSACPANGQAHRATEPSNAPLHWRTQSSSGDRPLRDAAADRPVWPPHQSSSWPEPGVCSATSDGPTRAAPCDGTVAMAIAVCCGCATRRWCARRVYRSWSYRGGDGGAALRGERHTVERGD